MNTLQFIKDIAWPVVAFFALIVLLVYRTPLGNLISNLRKGSVSYKKGEGVTGNLEINNPTIGVRSPILENQKLIEAQSIEYVESSQELSENNVTESVEVHQVLVEEHKVEDEWISLWMKGENVKSREILLKEIKQMEADNNTPSGYLLWLKCMAAKMLCQYDFPKGKEEFQDLINDNAEALMVYLQYFEVLQESGDLDTIYSLIDKYAGNKSNKYELLLKKAVLLSINNEFDKATTLLEELITQNDNLQTKASAYIEKGKILKKEKPDDAKKYFIRAYKLLPTDISMLDTIASLFGEMNEPKLELFLRKQHVDLEKGYYSWGYLGNIYLKLDLLNHSMSAYEKANELSSNKQQWIIANIGNLYNNVRLHDKAIEFLNLAHSMNPTDEYSTNRLSSVLSNKGKEEKKVQEIMDEARILISKIDNQ
jgi:tetratricopeptide (TPR) repeat protein